jgi:hypothetical protein
VLAPPLRIDYKHHKLEPMQHETRSMTSHSLNQTTKDGIIDAYNAWIRNNIRASDILNQISEDLEKKDMTMFMEMVSDVLADDTQVDEFKKFIRQNIAKPGTHRGSMERDALKATDQSLNQRMKDNVIDAYTAWYRNYKKAKVILHGILNEFKTKDMGMFMGMVSDVLRERRQVDDFKVFIRRNVPGHLSTSIPDHQLIHTLIQSMHERISAIEAKLL